jgi:hypothetical protein
MKMRECKNKLIAKSSGKERTYDYNTAESQQCQTDKHTHTRTIHHPICAKCRFAPLFRLKTDTDFEEQTSRIVEVLLLDDPATVQIKRARRII